jgi:hypothetical protein
VCVCVCVCVYREAFVELCGASQQVCTLVLVYACFACIYVYMDIRLYVCIYMYVGTACNFALQAHVYTFIYGHTRQVFREEFLQTCVKPINADVFTGFVGMHAKEDNEEARNLYNS